MHTHPPCQGGIFCVYEVCLAKLVVGLGNPGPNYAKTRHNVGSEVIDELERRHGVKMSNHGLATEGSAKIADADVILAHPRTFMNDSGRAVQSLMARHAVRDLSDVLIIVDEMDLPVGNIRFRASGSAGGHNGLKSIIQLVGGEAFPRLRVGIGRPDPGVEPIEHVLLRFRPDDRILINEAESYAADAVEYWAEHGAFETMNRFNGPRTVAGPGQ